jgi:hypothetical protein
VIEEATKKGWKFTFYWLWQPNPNCNKKFKL